MPAPHSTQAFNARWGVRLFLLYSLCYLSFTLINAFFPEWAEWKPAGGVNLAIWWGMGLIGLAFVLAVIYGLLCRSEDEPRPRPPDGSRGGGAVP